MDIDKPSLIFCIFALIAPLVLSALVLPSVMVPAEVVAATTTPVPAEDLGEVDVGDGFGVMPVSELAYYYAANPPALPAAEAAPVERRFGGC